MPQINMKKLLLLFPLLLSLLLMWGCGDSNSQADLDPEAGKHPAGWLPSGHKDAAKDHPLGCTDCHGNDFSGGISRIACVQCHLGNEQSVHPLQWGHFAYALHGEYVRNNGTASCANASCHGVNLNGVPDSGPSCTSCHMGGITAVHPLSWVPRFTDVRPGRNIYPTSLPDHGQYVNENGSAACRNATCHGTGGEGVFLSGRSCGACHI